MPVTPLRPSDPACVGPHRLLARLGQGGMGTVYLGVSPDERAVAVKVLRDGFPDPDARRRFRSELEALRRVRGPHLVEVLDADVEADLPYLVTRFVPGTRLDDLVSRTGPLPLEYLHRVARGLADALSALHDAGVVHRDLTPGNVLVLDGQPHVIDLGLATAADVTAMTRSGLVIGTPGYLAPEQVTGSSVSPAVDVHAWGATVALAGTGRPPYGTGRPEAVLYRIVHAQPDLEGLPPSLADLVHAAMDPDPARRPDARALLAELGGPTFAAPVTVHLPHDVDATTVLQAPALQPDPTSVLTLVDEPERELATATTGPRGVLPAGPPPPDWPPSGWSDEPPDRDGAPYDDVEDDLLPEDEPRRSPARELQTVVTGAAATAVVGAITLVAPVLGAACALLVLVLLRATGRGTDRLHSRRERRGARPRAPGGPPPPPPRPPPPRSPRRSRRPCSRSVPRPVARSRTSTSSAQTAPSTGANRVRAPTTAVAAVPVTTVCSSRAGLRRCSSSGRASRSSSSRARTRRPSGSSSSGGPARSSSSGQAGGGGPPGGSIPRGPLTALASSRTGSVVGRVSTVVGSGVSAGARRTVVASTSCGSRTVTGAAKVGPPSSASSERASGRRVGSGSMAAVTRSAIDVGSPSRSGCAWTMRYSTASGRPVPYGGRPVPASATVAPQACTSTAGLTAEPVTCSGAR